MSDLVGNPEDRFSRVEAHTTIGSGIQVKMRLYEKIFVCLLARENKRANSTNGNCIFEFVTSSCTI